MGTDEKDVRGFLEFVYEFYKSMKEHEISLVYEGEITHQITKAFTSLTESNMAKDEENNMVQKKVFHVMVECLQNISKHADDFGAADYLFSGRGIFLVAKGKNDYTVTTGNAVENAKIPFLKTLLEQVNRLDKDELTELYKKQIKEGRLSDKGGAGLGMIDIARKSGHKLDYNFHKISDKYSFFSLDVTVK